MSPRFSIIKSSNTKSTAASTIKHTHTHTHNTIHSHTTFTYRGSTAMRFHCLAWVSLFFIRLGVASFFSQHFHFLAGKFVPFLSICEMWVARANCEHTKRTQLVFKDGESFLRFIVLVIKHTNVFVVCIFTIWIWRAQHGIIVWMFVCAVYIQIIFHCKQVETTNKSQSESENERFCRW